jgi:RNA polymerase sigma-70 factor (ECF subfamily)
LSITAFSTANVEHASPVDQPVTDRAELAVVFEQNKSRLLRLISLRLDRRLAGRIDPLDIVQETFLRANAAFDDYRRLSNLPVYNWLRIQAQFAVGDCHRAHLGTIKRTACLEQREASSASVAALEELAESMISPASRVANHDLAEKIRERILGMAELDREILMLRHVEELSISEAAAELNISIDTAKKRHLRAIRRLQELCDGLNGSSVG